MQDMARRKSRRDVYAGLIFIAIAAGFAFEALRYELGTPLRMGPGFIPLLLAALLAVFGALTIAAGLRGDETADAAGPVPWRGILLVSLSLAVFGLAGRLLGLVPVVFVCTALTAMASARNTLLSAAVMASAISLLCYLIFKVGLGISLPTFGPVFDPIVVPITTFLSQFGS